MTTLHVPKTAELVAGVIRGRVLDGSLRPGDRLPHEAELLGSFGISRPTLREALRMLEAEELITVRRGARGGPVVRRPSAAPTLRALQAWLALAGDTYVTPVVLDEKTLVRMVDAVRTIRPEAAA